MSLQIFDSLEKIAAADWDSLSPRSFPFADHAYLRALETSQSVGRDVGWSPLYLTSWDDGKLRGAVYAYFKDNSYGEYIFDWAWLRAYQENGIPYFPKVVAAVPFTPATGPKLLVAADADVASVQDELIAGLVAITQESRASSLHFLFASESELPALERHGLLLRHSYQFHWQNRQYGSFEDFLGTFKSRKRKQIRQEREQLRQTGVSIAVLEGDFLTPELAVRVHAFYLSTIAKMGAIDYLTQDFFKTVFATMRDSVVVMEASLSGEAVATALYYRKGDALFGRYWGCSQELRGLHFELCYYQGIEYAIVRRLRLFEAGAQGEHKLARGFTPQLTFSAHWIQHPQFRAAIAQFIEQEKKEVAELFQQYLPHLPFKDAL